MNVSEIGTFISTVGFPIFVAVWMLYKTSKDSESMKEAINNLTNVINLLSNEIMYHNGETKDE